MPDNTPTPPEPDGSEPVEAEVVPTAPATGIAPVLPPDAPAPPPPPPSQQPDYDQRGVPSLDYVRDKIEGRYATSLGAAELVEDTAAARTVEQQEADRAEKAKAKLAEIRRSLGS